MLDKLARFGVDSLALNSEAGGETPPVFLFILLIIKRIQVRKIGIRMKELRKGLRRDGRKELGECLVIEMH